MKKQLAITICTTMFFLVATGCSNSSVSEQTVPDSVNAEEENTASQSVANPVIIHVVSKGNGSIALTKDENDQTSNTVNMVTSGDFEVEKGSDVRIMAQGDEGYILARWMKNGTYFSSDPEIKVTAEEETEYTAEFLNYTGYEGTPVSDIEAVHTLGDILALPNYGSMLSMVNEQGRFGIMFLMKEKVYAAKADLSSDLNSELWNIYDDNPEFYELLAPVEITSITDVTSLMPTQEMLDSYIGETGKVLIDEGWDLMPVNLPSADFSGDKGYFRYTVTFDMDPLGHTDFIGPTIEELVGDSLIKTVVFEGLGNQWIFED